jgi:hypothetical protein
MAKDKQFITQFNEISKDKEKLREFFSSEDETLICDAVVSNAGQDLGLKIWSSVLSLLNDEDKMLKIVETVSKNQQS